MLFTDNVNLVYEQTVFQFINSYYSPSTKLILLYYVMLYKCMEPYIYMAHTLI